MNLVTSIEQYHPRYVHFSEPIKNTVIPNSNFIRIYYSNNDMTLNGIYIKVSISNIQTEKYYNKYKCSFNKNENYKLIYMLQKFENDILNKYRINNKISQTILFNQLNQGSMKIFAESEQIFQTNMNFILKVSGIWENDREYGITYKFIPICSN